MANCEQMLIDGGGKPQTLKVRDERIDSVKYQLIGLVIIGHILGLPQFQTLPECVIVKNWIYLFHMPLFIFISGYFSKKKDIKSFYLGIWKLLEPLLLFQIIALIFYVPISAYRILTPWWVLWYLLSLIYWRIILQIIPDKILKNTKLILICTICISMLSGYVPINRLLSIQRTLAFMPFYFFGYCMKDKNIFLPIKYKPICLVFFILTIIIPILFPQYLGDLDHANSYDNVNTIFNRMGVFLFSIPMSISFVNICIKTPWIAQQGRLTMQYYIYHALMIPPLMYITHNLFIINSPFTAIIYTALILIVIGILTYLPNFDKFTNPSKFWKE